MKEKTGLVFANPVLRDVKLERRRVRGDPPPPNARHFNLILERIHKDKGYYGKLLQEL